MHAVHLMATSSAFRKFFNNIVDVVQQLPLVKVVLALEQVLKLALSVVLVL